MSSTDQVEAVETLTRVASLTMGLQEQIEIIRIINPKATVLPTDTEFEIGKRSDQLQFLFKMSVFFFSFLGQLHNSKACWSKLGLPDTTLYFFHVCLTLLGLTTFSCLVHWNTIKLSFDSSTTTIFYEDTGIMEKNFGVLLWGKFPKNELQTMGRKRVTPKVVSTIQPSIKYWKLQVLSCLNTLIHNLAVIFSDQTQMHLTMPNLEEFIPTWQIIFPDTLVLYVQVMHMSVL